MAENAEAVTEEVVTVTREARVAIAEADLVQADLTVVVVIARVVRVVRVAQVAVVTVQAVQAEEGNNRINNQSRDRHRLDIKV